MNHSKRSYFVATLLAIPCLANCVAGAPTDEDHASTSASLVSNEDTDGGVPVCSSTEQCAPGQVCVEGVCVVPDGGVPACSSSAECPQGEACIEGVCVNPDGGVEPDGGPDGGVEPDGGPDGGVEPDGGPDGGVEPDGGVDAGPAACSSGADCGPGQACVGGFCE